MTSQQIMSAPCNAAMISIANNGKDAPAVNRVDAPSNKPGLEGGVP